MNKPILFIDEKPFWGNDNIAKESLRSLRKRLSDFGGINEVEFFFEKYDEFPFDTSSNEFKQITADRIFIFIHNSHPHKKDSNGTLFPDNVVEQLETALQGKISVIRFSGNMYRRGLSDEEVHKLGVENLKRGRPLIETDVRIERDDLYDNFDMFVRYWLKLYNNPNFFILKYGQKANKGKAQEIEVRIKNSCWEEYIVVPKPPKTLSEKLTQTSKPQKKVRLKANWKDIVEADFITVCNLAGFDEDITREFVSELHKNDTQFNDFLQLIDEIIETEIKILPR